MTKKRLGKRKRNSSNFRILTEMQQIEDALEIIGRNDLKQMMSTKNDYFYLEKIMTFADVVTSGKKGYVSADKKEKGAFSEAKIAERAEKNYLFYSTKNEIANYERINKRNKLFFCETHQSNISMPLAFYEFLGLEGGARANKGLLLNSDKYHCYLVNACLRNLFEENLTSSTLQKLSRSKTGNQLIHNIEEDYTLVDVHIAVHGLGIKNDNELHNLRKNIFAKDKMCVLIEKDMNGSYRLYFMFYRNPKFYLLNNISMPSFLISDIDNEEDEKHQESRKGQTRWRNTLAEYALTLSVDDTSKVVCPFTLVEVSYPAEATLLRASHIKAYAECKNDDGSINNDEAYDIDNGFLVTANVDALFDKYLISVKDDGTVVTSKTISDSLVFDDLGIQRKIKPEYISEKKKKYLAFHKEKFDEREKKARI